MTAPTIAPTQWTIDSTHSNVEFSVKHLMITTVKGRFGAVAGTLDLAGPVPSVTATIDVATVDTRTAQRDDHLRSPDFFDVARYPTIGFRSTSLEGTFASPGDRFRIHGELTIRGTAKPVTLEAVYEGEGADPWGGLRRAFSATVTLDRRDFGLTWNQALETGGVLVSNEVRVSLEIQATAA